MDKNAKLTKEVKLAAIEIESVQFHLKMTKNELSSVKTTLAEERFSHKNLLKEHEKLQKETIDLRLDSYNQKAVLEKESGEAKRHILELQQTYKETLVGHQSIIKRLTDENSLMTGLLTAKETELRELDSLERNMESQLATSLLTIQKLDHALKQIRNVRTTQRQRDSKASGPVTRSTIIPRVVQECRGVITFQSISGVGEEKRAQMYKECFSRQDIQSLYTVDVDEAEMNLDSLEDVQLTE